MAMPLEILPINLIYWHIYNYAGVTDYVIIIIYQIPVQEEVKSSQKVSQFLFARELAGTNRIFVKLET